LTSDIKKLVQHNNSNDIATFEEVLAIIERARVNAFHAVNRELITIYWEIGCCVNEKAVASNWGKAVVQDFSRYIQSHFIGIKGFSSQNIWRMKQFYKTYARNKKLSPLVREIRVITENDVTTG
jgi:hypothetical protein